MGIRQLMGLLKKELNNKKVDIKCFKDKTIVVDTSIYMHEFKALTPCMIHSFCKMIRKFKEHNIKLIFVFDGNKKIYLKKECIDERKKISEESKEEYNKLIKKYEEKNKSTTIKLKLNKLKRNFVKLSYDDFTNLKTLFKMMNVEYIVAPYEADVICYEMVKYGYADMCMTNDSDLFAYGCNYVITNFNINTMTCFCYQFDNILKTLELSKKQFLELCVLAGTDYKKSFIHSTNIFELYKLINKKKVDIVNIITDKQKILLETIQNIYLNVHTIDEFNKYIKTYKIDNKLNKYTSTEIDLFVKECK